MSHEDARRTVVRNDELFRRDFYFWLDANWHVFEYFERSALKVWASGFTHYSHRTIWEVMRHRSNVREISGNFKLNDHYLRDCAQLYLLRHPEHAGLFNLKRRKSETATPRPARDEAINEQTAAYPER